MNKSGISRKDFISGALASLGLGALARRPIFAVEGGTDFGEPELVIGVVTDTHFQGDYVPGRGFWKMRSHDSPWYQDGPFWKALKYFQHNNVDAVMHCGDFADCGVWREMIFHSDAWKEVFGEYSTIDGTPTGKKVDKLFVLGHPDASGGEKKFPTTPPYGVLDHLAPKANPDESRFSYWGPEWVEYLRARDSWDDLWGEPYRDHWHKTLTGRQTGKKYHFFGCYRPDYHSAADNSEDYRHLHDMQANLIERARTDPSYTDATYGQMYDPEFDTKPFFMLMHAWPHGNKAGNLLAQYRNGITFYGHGHYNLIGTPFSFEGSNAQQKAFCVKAGMMKRNYSTLSEVNANLGGGFGDGRASGAGTVNMNHGWLLKIYSGHIVLHPVDFSCFFPGDSNNRTAKTRPSLHDHHCAPLGADFVLPIRFDYTPQTHPLSSANYRQTVIANGAPQFSPGAKLSLRYEADAAVLTIPRAAGNISIDHTGCFESDGIVTGTRVLGYNVEVAGATVYRSSVYAKGCHGGIGENIEDNAGITEFRIPLDKMPGGSVKISVWPRSPWGTRGKPISLFIQKSVSVSLEKSVPNVNRNARFVLTNGAHLPQDTKISVDPVPWVERVVVEDGEIVAYTRPVGSTVGVK